MRAAPATPLTAQATRVDLIVSALLWSGTVALLAALPRNLGRADEAFFLVEAKRILGGDLLYRDMFWFAGPIGQWCMAVAFGVFGVTITVARMAMAALQGTLVVVLYVCGRRSGVRPSLAVAPALLHLAFCFGLWPYASPHWFSTLMMAAILCSLLALDRVARPARALWPGLFPGALALSHQHQGAFFALAVAALFAIEGAIARRSGRALRPRTWWHSCLWYALGTCLVAVPGILYLLATTGAGPLIEQTILHPLSGYRQVNRTSWGSGRLPLVTAYTWPPLLSFAPLALVPTTIRLAIGWRRRASLAELDPLAILLIVGVAGILSIAYNPDLIHVGFVAPLLFVAGAEALDALLRGLERKPALARGAAALLAIGLVAGSTERLVRTYHLLWREHPFHMETAFGGIDFGLAQETRLVELLDEVMADQPRRVLFAYPTWAQAYLAADTRNPTSHPLFIPGYLPPVEIDRTLADLARERPPYVLVMNFPTVGSADDPILSWVREHYDVYRSDPDPALPFTLYRARGIALPRS